MLWESNICPFRNYLKLHCETNTNMVWFFFFQENKLAMLGGGTLKDSVRRVMSHLLTNTLSWLYNWEGRLGWKSADAIQKRAFSGLLLTRVITS